MFKNAMQKAGLASFVLLVSAPAFADVEAAITSAQTTILGIVAAAGAAFIAVALAGVGWSVGAKMIKRIGGKA